MEERKRIVNKATEREAMASGAACNPIIFEPMVMSFLLAHQKKIIELEHKLHGARV
jgi:hypothetical protein